MNRGSQCLAVSGRHHPAAFNEAPIHESGKFHADEAQARRRVPLQ